VLGAHYPVANRPELEADRSPALSAAVKNVRRCRIFPPPIHHIIQRDTFTVFLVNLYHVRLSINQGACYAIIPVTTVYSFAQYLQQYVK